MEVTDLKCQLLENVQSYLLKILERTESKKQSLERECQEMHEVLTRRTIKYVNNEVALEEAGATQKCDCKYNSMYGEILSKMNEALECSINSINNMDNKRNALKTGNSSLLQHSVKSKINLSNKRKEDSNSLQHSSVRNKSNKPTKKKELTCKDMIKYPVTVKCKDVPAGMRKTESNPLKIKKIPPQKIVTEPVKKDFTSQTKTKPIDNVKNAVQKKPEDTASSFQFKDIDDILNRVTSCTKSINKKISISSTKSKCDKDSSSNDSKTQKLKFLTLPEAVHLDCFNWSKDFIKIFSSHHKLTTIIDDRKRTNQGSSSRFLVKLKERNDSFTSHNENKVEQYTIWMEMRKKCSVNKKACLQSRISFQDSVFQLMSIRKPIYQQIELKLCQVEALNTQLEMLHIIQNGLSKSYHELYNSTGFNEICESLFQIIPSIKT